MHGCFSLIHPTATPGCVHLHSQEDPATGAAAAALGAYLRQRQLIETPTDIVIHQGHDMGRPSLLTVHIPYQGGIRVTGTVVSGL